LSDTPISDYALLADGHSAALVDKMGSVDWWCAPRFDSPSVFGRILDGTAGHFSVRPAEPRHVERRYLDKTLVVEGRVKTSTGTVEMLDALALAEGVRGHDLGKRSPHLLLKWLRCTSGRVELDIELMPRFEYGLTTPLIEQTDGGVVARGGPAALMFSTSAQLRISGGTATGVVSLEAEEEVAFAVAYASSWEPTPEPLSPDRVKARIEDTSEAWRSWADDHQTYEGPFAEAVELGGRVLQGLTFTPTGAVVAAPTTSLPETIGGSRNWDYRYSWVRDASFTLDALWVAACPDEEQHFFKYLATAASSIHSRDQVQIVFGISGERDLTEREIPWLEGWRESKPVRVGNGAWKQRQNDVYGELLAAAHRLKDRLEWDEAQRALLTTAANLAAKVWTEPDHGIWEMRTSPRHHLYSKLMCWVALDRAIDMADELQAGSMVAEWESARGEIREAILTKGWHEDVEAFTQSFGSPALDASALLIPVMGFLPATDQRVTSTIEAIEADLLDDQGLLMRYRSDDGLEGEEGSFFLCTFWLAQAHALAGRLDRAREVLSRAYTFASDLGLLSEEVDRTSGELIGNFPQALSHIGLINAAWAIAEAERA
jgi:GH15 family glucan-1,4-alpha-glucosidase